MAAPPSPVNLAEPTSDKVGMPNVITVACQQQQRADFARSGECEVCQRGWHEVRHDLERSGCAGASP